MTQAPATIPQVVDIGFPKNTTGMNEGSVLLWLEQAHREGAYDLIVVDSAPTGETLTLLTLPEVTQWWVSRALPFQKVAIKTVGFAVRKTLGIPLDKGYEELNLLFEQARHRR